MSPTFCSLVLVLAPLAGAFWGAGFPRQARQAVLGALLVSAGTSILLACTRISHLPHQEVIAWIPGTPGAQAGFRWDSLSLTLVVLVSVIALCVGVFSLYYMQRQPPRYWGYLGLFAASMLGLALSPNLLQLFVCWELVGFSSFLLISYYRTAEASRAAPLAFWTNRIGDAGLLAGMLLLWVQQGHTGWDELQLQGSWVPLLLFCGTLAKSAQFPLQVWLPAAMAGPTPASALIHAATMVAAGVFLLLRTFPVFTPDALQVVAWIGVVTALLAALAAFRQTDLKRLLAFSTISQLGYMVAAVGLGAWQAAYFHLLTHAVFKAALFLGAGVLIHELGHAWQGSRDPQDMRHMGGLARRLPFTAASMILAAAALAGLPLTAGFLSKEAILTQAWAVNPVLFGLLGVGALLTAAYSFRMIWQVFVRPNTDAPVVRERGLVLKLPLVVLGLGSLWLAFGLHPLAAADSWPL
ncbi:MAG: NADH-quinone oxidoreductase subunit L, partial [Bacteroidetes bacterium]|nr:NADH-quinone oxidoreductase subunit L [Bacteroidota bacterium]